MTKAPPELDPPVPSDDPVRSDLSLRSEDPGSGGDLRVDDPVLVVDDDPAIRAVFARSLRAAGFEVLEAEDGPGAIDIFETETLSVVLLDARMPGMSGAEVLEAIRAAPHGRSLPVILVAADQDLATRVGALEAGADDYITKPVELADLVARVRAQVRSGAVWARWVAALEQRLDAVVLLRRITPGSDAPVIAGAVCDELLRYDGVVAVGIVQFQGPRGAVALAGGGEWAGWLATGEPLNAEVARRLARSVERGPYLDRASARQAPVLAFAGLPPVAWEHDVSLAPIYGRDETLGVLAIASDPASEGARGGTILASAIDFAAVLSALLAPHLEHEATIERARTALQELVARGAFVSTFQPVVELESGDVVGFEALTQWEDRVRPDLRFSEAHRLGIGIDVERVTLAQILREATALPPNTWLSLNASPAMVRSGALDDLLANQPRTLVLELTEHEAIDDYDALRKELARHPGLVIAVDDAGAGYASLRHVLDLKPDIVKLDINWVHDIDGDPARQALMTAMVGFAREMKIDVIAEGIETSAERRTLVNLGVTYGQGYLYARPAAAADVSAGPLAPIDPDDPDDPST